MEINQMKINKLKAKAWEVLKTKNIEEIKEMDRQLRIMLGSMDSFWIRWSFQLEKLNIEPQVERYDMKMTKEDFTKRMDEVTPIPDMSDQEIANYLHVSRPTFIRWRKGESAPFRSLRQIAIAKLEILKNG